MADSRYKRVSRARPCLICGKPDWCSRTADDSISFCARITAGADRLSRKEQWGVFFRDRDLCNQSFRETTAPRNFYKREKCEIPNAPLEIRNFVYSSLLRLSSARNYELLINGGKGLRERGIKDFENYGGLPGSRFERNELAARLRFLFNQNFPAFVRQNPHGIRGIPGFWLDDAGKINLWQTRDYQYPLLLIPYRSPTGLIQACQIRFTGDLEANKKRYLWLSLPEKGSASSGTPLHFADWRNFGNGSFADKPVLVTEGALKADAVSNLSSEFFPVANGGVSCSHEIIVQITRRKPLYLAFDNDYHKNPAVIRQIARLLKPRLEGEDEDKSAPVTKIIVWSVDQKGVDDALLHGEKLDEISIQDWFAALDENCRGEVRKVWEEVR